MIGQDFYFVIDLEATCWEQEDNIPDVNEIIEIGLAACDINGNVISTFQSFVKPKINDQLSNFCMNLTKIKQKWIDSARPLIVVQESLENWTKNHFNTDLFNIVWTSWGDFDMKCFKQDCQRNNIRYRLGPHCSSKTLHSQKRKCKKCGVKEALRLEGLTFEGTHHRGIDDAINIARIIKSANMMNDIMQSAVIA